MFHPQVILGSVVLTGTILTGYRVYNQNLKRIPSSYKIPQSYFKKRFMYGRVTSVGDGDNFHFYHLPGGRLAGWGWLRLYPKVNDFKGNKNQTIPVRLCGVDAPERSHFGKPAQPYSEELLIWLRNFILGQKLWVKPLSIDQYLRVVGKVVVWKWFPFGWRDVSSDMIRNGIGVVYEGVSSAEFDGKHSKYLKLEKAAKSKKKGLWNTKSFVSPGEYKKIYK